MNNILNQFNEKITSLIENYLTNLIFSNGISSFTDDLIKEFAEFGSKLTQYLIDIVEDEIFNANRELQMFKSLEKDIRNVVSIFGNITFKRRYYLDKQTNEKIYLLDKVIGIKANENLLLNVEERLIEEAVISSYEHAGEIAAYNTKISRQEVKNKIEKLDLNKDFYITNNKIKKSKFIYIIADEDHVHLQKGGIEEPRIIVVYDSVISNGKRIILNNKRHFGGIYKNKLDELWNEVVNYIESNYDMDYVEKVFILGDGANWIKNGTTWINKSEFVLDTFHMCKAINAISGTDNNKSKKTLYKAIRNLNFDLFQEECYLILSEEMNQKSRNYKEKAMNYILNNQIGITNLYTNRKILHGCSAEGHVSHIYSDRMSSRPLGWKTENVNNMSKLRLLREDNIKIRTILESQSKIINIEEYKELKENTKNKIKKNKYFKPIELPILKYGVKEYRKYFRQLLDGKIAL